MEKAITPEINVGIRTNNYVEFPFQKLVPSAWDANTLIFRLFVDCLNGNDSFNGMSWGQAKKTINAALAELPINLESRTAFIAVHSGTYNETVSLANLSNGSIFLFHAKTTMNSDPWWNPLAETSPVRDNDPITVNGGSYFALFSGWTQNFDLSLTIDSTTLNDQKLMWGRWIFKNSNGTDQVIFLRNLAYIFIKNLVIDLSSRTAGLSGMQIDGSKTRVRIVTLGIVGNAACSISSGSSGWYGALCLFTAQGELTFDGNWWNQTGNNAFETGFLPPHSKWFDFDTIRNIYTSGFGPVSKFVHVSFPDFYWNAGSLGISKPVIYLTSDFGGKVTYNKTICDLTDNSTLSRIIVENSASVTQTILTNRLKEIGNNSVTKFHTAVIADADLQNGEQSIWIDETNSKLKVKVKKANGTILNGEITLA